MNDQSRLPLEPSISLPVRHETGLTRPAFGSITVTSKRQQNQCCANFELIDNAIKDKRYKEGLTEPYTSAITIYRQRYSILSATSQCYLAAIRGPKVTESPATVCTKFEGVSRNFRTARQGQIDAFIHRDDHSIYTYNFCEGVPAVLEIS